MIHYQLRCADAHEFDGWFRNSAAFEAQVDAGLLECPACGSREVARALMAPAVPRKENARQEVVPAAAPEPAKGPPAQVAATGQLPAHLQAMLQKLRSEVEKNCDYVGPGFADEARKIHRGESEKRGIYGESTPDEAQSLADEGIEVSQIPWVPRSDG